MVRVLGWISPNGTFYNVGSETHLTALPEMHRKGIIDLRAILSPGLGSTNADEMVRRLEHIDMRNEYDQMAMEQAGDWLIEEGGWIRFEASPRPKIHSKLSAIAQHEGLLYDLLIQPELPNRPVVIDVVSEEGDLILSSEVLLHQMLDEGIVNTIESEQRVQRMGVRPFASKMRRREVRVREHRRRA
jgi:hypothetical protein